MESAPTFDLADRLIEFAVSVGRVAKRLPRDRLATHVASQLVRCATAPAACYAEARAAESRRDFIHKMQLALKELRETLVWLTIACRVEPARRTGLVEAQGECGELIAIFVKSVQTAKTNVMKVERRLAPSDR